MTKHVLEMKIGPQGVGSWWEVTWHRHDGDRVIVRGKSTRAPFERTQERWLTYLKKKVQAARLTGLVNWKDAEVTLLSDIDPAGGIIVKTNWA